MLHKNKVTPAIDGPSPLHPNVRCYMNDGQLAIFDGKMQLVAEEIDGLRRKRHDYSIAKSQRQLGVVINLIKDLEVIMEGW